MHTALPHVGSVSAVELVYDVAVFWSEDRAIVAW